jgi:hypothetical protein
VHFNADFFKIFNIDLVAALTWNGLEVKYRGIGKEDEKYKRFGVGIIRIGHRFVKYTTKAFSYVCDLLLQLTEWTDFDDSNAKNSYFASCFYYHSIDHLQPF